MKKFIRIGVDLANNYFQVHALESEGGKVASRKLRGQASAGKVQTDYYANHQRV